MKKISTIILTFACILTGCNYLDTVPGDSMTGDTFWSTADAVALRQYCNTYYPRLIVGHGDPNGWTCGDMIVGEYQSDNLLSTGQNALTYGQNTINNSDSRWNWSTVRGCNAFINNYEKSPAPLAEKQKYAGEIYFFKAWDYFNKVRTFGDVPWYDKELGKNDPDLYKGRDSRIVVMDKIVETIDKAIELLPKKTSVSRVSKDAAICLKARICLFEGTYRRYRDIEGGDDFLKLAYDAAGMLMDPGFGYSLYTEGGPDQCYFNLFIQPSYKDNPEIILSREYDPEINMGNDVTRLNGSHGMSRDCFEEYLCSKTGKPVSICGCHNPSMGMVAEMKNRDGRLVQSVCVPEAGNPHSNQLFRTINGKIQGGAPNIQGMLTASATRPFYAESSTGYSISKFFSMKDFEDQALHHGTIDAPVMRYAEILLIRAEAGAELGLDPELDKTVNALRERVGFPFKLAPNPEEDPDLVSKYPVIKGPDANLIREIRRERRVELFCENFRWNDIVRWKVGNEVFNLRERRGAPLDPKLYSESEIEIIKSKVGVDDDGFILPYKVSGRLTPNFTDKNYLFNVPLNQISLNPNLLPQNPGWEE